MHLSKSRKSLHCLVYTTFINQQKMFMPMQHVWKGEAELTIFWSTVKAALWRQHLTFHALKATLGWNRSQGCPAVGTSNTCTIWRETTQRSTWTEVFRTKQKTLRKSVMLLCFVDLCGMLERFETSWNVTNKHQNSRSKVANWSTATCIMVEFLPPHHIFRDRPLWKAFSPVISSLQQPKGCLSHEQQGKPGQSCRPVKVMMLEQSVLMWNIIGLINIDIEWYRLQLPLLQLVLFVFAHWTTIPMKALQVLSSLTKKLQGCPVSLATATVPGRYDSCKRYCTHNVLKHIEVFST